MKNFYIVRGVSGSGKSTFSARFAALMNAPHLEADKLLYDEEGVYQWTREAVTWAHKETYNTISSLMDENTPDIVLSDTSARPRDLKIYLDLAKEKGYLITCLVMEKHHNNPSLHDVSEETLEKQRQRIMGSMKLI